MERLQQLSELRASGRTANKRKSRTQAANSLEMRLLFCCCIIVDEEAIVRYSINCFQGSNYR